MPEIDFSFLGIFLTICFVLLLIALMIVTLPTWVWFVVFLYIIVHNLLWSKK
jgi:uncharacterized membrane protein